MENTNFQSSDLEELLNLLKSNSDSYILEKFTDALKGIVENISPELLELGNSLPVIYESIQILTTLVFEEENISVISRNLHLELLLLLSLLKLNFLNECDIQYCNTSLSIINTGIKLVKYFNDFQYNLKAEYYSRKCKASLSTLVNEKRIQEQCPIKITLKEMQMTLDVYHIDALINSDKLNEAFDEIQNIKYSILDFPNHKDYFFYLCYNAGVKILEKEHYENAIVILETAHSMTNGVDTPIHVEICNLLVHVYLKFNAQHNWDKCLNVLDSVPHSKLLPSSMFKILKAALLSKAPTVIEKTLQKITKGSDLSFDVVLKISKELETNSYGRLSVEFLRNMRLGRFETHEKLHLMSLELREYLKGNCLEKANMLVDDAMELLQVERDILPNSVHCLCREMTAYSQAKFKAKLFSESLNWYMKCSRLMESSKACDVPALRYIHQRMCLCHIELNDAASAKRILESLDTSSNSTDPFDLYLALRVAVMAEDDALVEIVLNYIGTEDGRMKRVLLPCCKSAFDSGKSAFLCKILEAVLQKCNLTTEEYVTVSQCLIRLYLRDAGNEASFQKILTFLCETSHSFQKNQRELASAEQLEWFYRISWNLSLRSDLEPCILFQLSLVCCRFLECICGPVLRLRNAFMTTVTSGLQCLRTQQEDKQRIAKKILWAIEKLKHLETDDSPTTSLLLAYEFETKLLSNDSAVEFSLKQLLKSSCVDAKSLKNIAAIAYERSPTYLKWVSMALKGAIQKVLERPVVDYQEVSCLYHTLLQILFHNKEFLMASVENESFEVCQELLKLMEDVLKDYPQMEVLWLMSKCWNWGMQRLASGSNPIRARDWCSLALGFARKLGELEPIHGKKLSILFSTYFGQQDPTQPDA